jgi:hypothetical protein
MALALALALVLLAAPPAGAGDGGTSLISRTPSGDTPDGASEKAVISADRRFAALIAFESDATNLVSGDSNDQRDVFAIKRGGSFGNTGTPWQVSAATLVSRGRNGPADGRSFDAAVDGSTTTQGSCVAFLSEATNLVSGDTNGKVDAFVSDPVGSAPRRVSLVGGNELDADVTAVTVSANCSRVAFTAGGELYVSDKSRATKVGTRGDASDPSFAKGKAASTDLVFADRGGAYLAKNGTGEPKRIAENGTQPVYTNIDGQYFAYVKGSQVFWVRPGEKPRPISSYKGKPGNAPSSKPQIGNDGLYALFESKASNLGLTAGLGRGDRNRKPDVFLYTGVRNLTTVQSVRQKGIPLPGGGANPGLSYYANYVIFDSPANLQRGTGARQIFMRYLGGV